MTVYRRYNTLLRRPAGSILDFDGLVRPPRWTTSAVCASIDPFLFFPEKGQAEGATARAKRICRTCPVAAQCLEYALAFEGESDGDLGHSSTMIGIWGGHTVTERQKILRQRRREAS